MPSTAGVVSRYFSGQGIVMVAARDQAGNALGFRNVGNVADLSITVDTTVFEHKETSTGARATDLRLTQEVSVNVTATLESITAENLALGIYGTASATVAGSATDESIVAKLGKTIPLAHMNISTVVVTNVGATITYVENENYTINPEHGSLNILDATAQGSATNPIAEDDTLLVDYAYLGYNSVGALVTAQPERWVRFEGLNTAENNDPVVIDIFRFAADPLTDFPLINEELSQITLEGSALADQTKLTGSKFFNIKMIP